jgi:hypothetical protein
MQMFETSSIDQIPASSLCGHSEGFAFSGTFLLQVDIQGLI